MEGFILAAGLGTRLRPLTDTRPKALVELCGQTLLERTIHKLEDAGVDRIVVNVHHFADMVELFVRDRQWKCPIVISDERQLLLDTGGALRHAAPLFSGTGPVLVHNVDVVSDIDLHALEEAHRHSGNLVTLCVSRRDTKRELVFSAEGLLLGRKGEVEEPSGAMTLAFSGVSMVDPHLFSLLPHRADPFPIIPVYIALSPANRIGAYVHSAEHWFDVGKPDTLEKARLWIDSFKK